jgi:hypothetical protein
MHMVYRVLALSGGGVTGGEFQRGALSVLSQRVDKVDFVCGIGVGSLNSSLLAQHDTLREGVASLEQVWTGIRRSADLFETPLLGAGPASLGALIGEDAWVADSIYTAKATRKLIEKHVDWKRLRGRNNWAVGVTSLTDTCFYTVTNDKALLSHFNATHPRSIELSLDPESKFHIGEHIHDLLTAAASPPVLLPPVDLFGHKFCEGGLRDYVPVALAVTAYQLALKKHPGLEAELIVMCSESAPSPVVANTRLDSGREILARLIRIMAREMQANDLSGGQARIRDTPGAKATFRVLAPQKEFGLEQLDFDQPEKRQQLRQHGADVARSVLV